MGGIGSRRGRTLAAAAMAAFLLVGTAACGGSSDAGSSDGTKTTKASGSGDDTASKDDGGGSDLPDPCELVTLDKASEILGGESAPADDMDSDPSTGLRACTWQTKASKDDPTLDGAGHVLTLTVLSPMGGMSAQEFFDSAKEASTGSADVDGCDDAYWVGGQLSAIKGKVLLGAAAGLADDSEDAKASTTDLMAAACGAL